MILFIILACIVIYAISVFFAYWKGYDEGFDAGCSAYEFENQNFEGLYPYCDYCPIPFESEQEKKLCGLHWRPKTGTKAGFPMADGFNCPKDVLNKKTKNDCEEEGDSQ